MAAVPSVLPESTTTISSAIPFNDARARGRLCSSLSVIRQAERRFIGCVGSATLSSVSYTLDATSSGRNLQKLTASKRPLFFLEADTNPALANPKLRAVLQHGCPYALFVIERAIGGIKIFQVDDFVAHFQQAMVPRNLRVIQRDIRALSPDHDSRFC